MDCIIGTNERSSSHVACESVCTYLFYLYILYNLDTLISYNFTYSGCNFIFLIIYFATLYFLSDTLISIIYSDYNRITDLYYYSIIL